MLHVLGSQQAEHIQSALGVDGECLVERLALGLHTAQEAGELGEGKTLLLQLHGVAADDHESAEGDLIVWLVVVILGGLLFQHEAAHLQGDAPKHPFQIAGLAALIKHGQAQLFLEIALIQGRAPELVHPVHGLIEGDRDVSVLNLGALTAGFGHDHAANYDHEKADRHREDHGTETLQQVRGQHHQNRVQNSSAKHHQKAHPDQFVPQPALPAQFFQPLVNLLSRSKFCCHTPRSFPALPGPRSRDRRAGRVKTAFLRHRASRRPRHRTPWGCGPWPGA